MVEQQNKNYFDHKLNWFDKIPTNLPEPKSYVSCTVVEVNEKLTLVSKLNPDFFKEDNEIKDIIFLYKDASIWFTDKIQKRDKKSQEFITTLNHVGDRNILLDKSKIELTLLTQNGGFVLKGCPT